MVALLTVAPRPGRGRRRWRRRCAWSGALAGPRGRRLRRSSGSAWMGCGSTTCGTRRPPWSGDADGSGSTRNDGGAVTGIEPASRAWKARPVPSSRPDATPMPQVRASWDRPLLTVSDRQMPMLRPRGGHGRRGPSWIGRSSDGHKLNRRVRSSRDDHLPRWQALFQEGAAAPTLPPSPVPASLPCPPPTASARLAPPTDCRTSGCPARSGRRGTR